MKRRTALSLTTVAVALAVLVAACDSAPASDDHSEQDKLRAYVVSSLDFPLTVADGQPLPVFQGWEIVDATDRPDPAQPAPDPALVMAAGQDTAAVAAATTAPEACSARGEYGSALWQVAHGTTAWAGEVGAKSDTNQSFRVDLSSPARGSLDAVDRFAQHCATYTVSMGGKTVDATTKLTDPEPLRYGLNDVRILTTTAKLAGADLTFSTLTAIGTAGSRIVSAQFTSPGVIDGPVINVVGNWWAKVATRAANGAS